MSCARAAQQLRKVAGVVDLGEAVAIEQTGVVRHCVLRHHVARAHFGRLEAQPRRQPVNDAFHGEYRLGSAGAAIGGSEGGMREHALHLDRYIGHVVGAEKVRERVVRHHQAEKVVRAAIHHRLVAQRHKATFPSGRQCDAVDLVARMRSRAEVFAAALHPAHRPREFARGERDQHVLRRLHAFLSEAAANVAGDDADALRGHAKRHGHQRLQAHGPSAVLDQTVSCPVTGSGITCRPVSRSARRHNVA